MFLMNILDNKINFPSSLDQQKEIVSQLDQLSAQTELLQQKYQQKLLQEAGQQVYNVWSVEQFKELIK